MCPTGRVEGRRLQVALGGEATLYADVYPTCSSHSGRRRLTQLPTADDARSTRLVEQYNNLWDELQNDLDLGSFRHGEAIQKLRADAEAGLLLVTVEQWLHSGREEAVSAEQLDELLAPYARSPAAEADPQEQAATEENR